MVVRPFSPPWGFAAKPKRLHFTGAPTRRPASRRRRLQRFFSTFPAGLPALGLLLLRVAVGAALVARGAATLADRDFSSVASAILAPSALVSGCALVVGFFTPAAAALAAIVGVGGAVVEGGLAAIFLVVMAVAVMLLGPRAFSVDARLFGRREIVVPRSSRRIAPD